MAGYIIVDVKTRKIIGIAALVTLLFFVLGIIIGFFSGKGSSSCDEGHGTKSISDALAGTCPLSDYSGEGKKYVSRYLSEASEGVCIHDNEGCPSYGLPRHYIAYHLRDKTINIDGKLDDEAWAEVPWTEDFVDIRESLTWKLPTPRLATRAKIRWDDNRLYVGAYILETDLWGVITEDEKPIYQDNDFEVLVDVDGTLLNFKQMLINVRNASWDLMYYRSAYDHTDPNTTAYYLNWTAGIQKNVYYEGTINNPSDTDKFWSLEWSFTFDALAKESQRSQPLPAADEVWFLNFGRAEWNLTVTPDNQYKKVAQHWGHSSNSWWAWNPCGSVNLLLQNRWGLVQFKRNIHDKTFLFKRWPVYKALFDVFDALMAYKGKNGKFIDQLEELDIPPYLFTRKCVEIPTISVNNAVSPQQFNVTVMSRVLIDDVGHIRQDRYVWFDT